MLKGHLIESNQKINIAWYEDWPFIEFEEFGGEIPDRKLYIKTTSIQFIGEEAL